jgi:hypothetical protein
MGLDVSHGNFSMSYGSFNILRTKICSSLGLEMNSFKGFGGFRDWKELKSPIKPLLNHSDCDGNLTVAEMEAMIPELERLVGLWEPTYFKSCLIELIDSMKIAVNDKEPLEFQ